jgi:hypothetical protein
MRPDIVYEHPTIGIDGMLRGLIGDNVQTRDPFITKQVTRHLFASDPVEAVGTDLMSLNIQRGRDHGLPGKIITDVRVTVFWVEDVLQQNTVKALELFLYFLEVRNALLSKSLHL